MEFTKDIKFNGKPTFGEPLTITYSGFLSNSNAVYIVYGYGENWENTTEKPMEKTNNSFTTEIVMNNFDTFNFCFKNSENIWDNNSSFNYIAPIENKNESSETNHYECENVIDEIINSIELDNSISDETETILETQDSIQLLDELFEDLLIEYSNIKNIPTEQELDSNIDYAQELDNALDNLYQEIIANDPNAFAEQEQEFDSNIDYAQELDNALDNLYQEIIANNPNAFAEQEQEFDSNIDYAQEIQQSLNSLYEEAIQYADTNEVENLKELVDTLYTEMTTFSNEEEVQEPIIDYAQEVQQSLNSLYEEAIQYADTNEVENLKELVDTLYTEMTTFSNEEEIQETNINYAEEVDQLLNNLFNDISNQVQSFAEEENIDYVQKVDSLLDDLFGPIPSEANIYEEESTTQFVDIGVEISKAFEGELDLVSEEESLANFNELANFVQELSDDESEENYFDYSNLEFSYDNLNIEKPEQEVVSQSEKTLFANNFSDSFYDDNASEEVILENATKSNDNEYVEYFDDLLDEIVKRTTSALAKPVTKEEVKEKENDILGIENKPTETQTIEAVPNEYALYDYKSYSFFYMLKRRFKIIFNTLFEKLPSLFSIDNENENN